MIRDHRRRRVLLVRSVTGWGTVYGLQFRFPYHDLDVVNFLASLPGRGRDKSEFRKLASRLLPREIAYAPKFGQSVPIQEWFSGPLRTWVLERLSPNEVRADGTINPDAVQSLLQSHFDGARRGWEIWKVLSLLAWKREILAASRKMG